MPTPSRATDTDASLLIVGASARAAAEAAHRCGLSVDAIDLFGDLDLSDACRASVVADDLTVDAVERAWSELPHPKSYSGWLPVGGLENRPDVWSLLDQLVGVPASGSAEPRQALSQLRDPACWKLCALESGLGFPETRWRAPHGATENPNADPPARWLTKSTTSAGGLSVSIWEPNRDGDNARTPEGAEGRSSRYWQREVIGADYSALAWCQEGDMEWWGATRQWSGLKACGAEPFWYCGSLGPVSLGRHESAVRAFLSRAARETNWTGCLGVDLRLSDSAAWVLEINPRYPAGAEVLERASGRSLAARAAGQDSRLPVSEPSGDSCWGKLIWYLPAGERRRSRSLDRHVAGFGAEADLHDLPRAGLEIVGPAPGFTVTARLPNSSETLDLLIERGRYGETLIFELI